MSNILKDAKTVWVSDDVFNIPNTRLSVYNIKLEVDGNRDTYKTMSDKIATEGWEGDIEVYTNKNGKEYVRQAPKEETFTPSGGKGGKGGWQPKDEKSITLGLVFKTFCSVEAMLPQKPEHWEYIEKCTMKMIEISNRLNGKDKSDDEQSGYEKAKEVANKIKRGDFDDDVDYDSEPAISKEDLNKIFPY